MFVTKLKIVAATLLVISLAAGGVLTHRSTAAPQPKTKTADDAPKREDGRKKDAEPTTVKAVKPKQGAPMQTVQTSITVLPAQKQEMVPLVSCTTTIKEIAVDIGDYVRMGQTLIVLDAPLLAKDVEQAAASLELAQAQAEEAQATVAEAQRGAARVSLERAQAASKAAKANVKLAQVALDKARIQEGFTRLRAVFDGVVIGRHCGLGDIIPKGTMQPLMLLARVDRLRAEIELKPYFARIARLGDPVELIAPGVEGITGKIVRISPAINGSTRTAIIEVDNPKNRLLPGMKLNARIRFDVARMRDVFVVPGSCISSYVHDSSVNHNVYVVRHGKAYSIPVTIVLDAIGRNDEDSTDLLIEGIKASDLVITDLDLLDLEKLEPDGTPVKVEKMP